MAMQPDPAAQDPSLAGGDQTDPTAGTNSTAAGGGDNDTIDPSQGYVICITVKPDQTFSVSVEPNDPDMDAEQDDSQAAPTLRAAWQVVQDIVKNAGQISDAGAGQDAMSGGYGAPAGMVGAAQGGK